MTKENKALALSLSLVICLLCILIVVMITHKQQPIVINNYTQPAVKTVTVTKEITTPTVTIVIKKLIILKAY